MTTATFENSQQYQFSSSALIQRGWKINRPLTTFILICLGLTAAGIVGMMVDPRTLNGQSVWAKPVKFGISNAIYSATILVMLNNIQPRPRWVNWVYNLTSFTLATGMTVITLQAARGVKSHYNFSTPFDMTVLSIMGLSTLLLTVVSLVACVLLVRQPLTNVNHSVVWGAKLGMLVTVLVGFTVGTLMMRPSDSQMAKLEAGEVNAGGFIGAHTIGAEDGGPGLPILGWSTTDGDLRPAHFFGLHALQILPLLGLLVSRRSEQWLAEGHRLSLVVIGSLSFTGFIGLLTWQALRGESIVSPSAETFAALLILIGTSVLAAGATVLHAHRLAE